jgi:hypothetical protein
MQFLFHESQLDPVMTKLLVHPLLRQIFNLPSGADAEEKRQNSNISANP